MRHSPLQLGLSKPQVHEQFSRASQLEAQEGGLQSWLPSRIPSPPFPAVWLRLSQTPSQSLTCSSTWWRPCLFCLPVFWTCLCKGKAIA